MAIGVNMAANPNMHRAVIPSLSAGALTGLFAAFLFCLIAFSINPDGGNTVSITAADIFDAEVVHWLIIILVTGGFAGTILLSPLIWLFGLTMLSGRIQAHSKWLFFGGITGGLVFVIPIVFASILENWQQLVLILGIGFSLGAFASLVFHKLAKVGL